MSISCKVVAKLEFNWRITDKLTDCYLRAAVTPVEYCIASSVNTRKVTKPLSVSDAKSAGFTVLEKRDEGTYEKL